MVTEIAEIQVKPGMAEQFIAAVTKAAPIFARAAGCHGMELHHVIETPDSFVLMVKWESVAHHTEKFVPSADFQEWRALVGDCFGGKPKVFHTNTVV